MECVKVAVVGCGDISGRHLAAFRNSADRARVVACCDTDPEKAQKAAEQTGTESIEQEGPAPERARAVTDFAEILADPAIQAVDLCLPHHLHAPLTIAAAEAG